MRKLIGFMLGFILSLVLTLVICLKLDLTVTGLKWLVIWSAAGALGAWLFGRGSRPRATARVDCCHGADVPVDR